jgi:hypothetical protein
MIITKVVPKVSSKKDSSDNNFPSFNIQDTPKKADVIRESPSFKPTSFEEELEITEVPVVKEEPLILQDDIVAPLKVITHPNILSNNPRVNDILSRYEKEVLFAQTPSGVNV